MLESFPTRNEDFVRFTPDALTSEGRDLADRSEAVEARAYGSWYESIPDGPDGVSLTVTEMGGLTQLLAPGVDHLLFNRVLGLKTLQEPPVDDLEVLLERFRTAGVPRFFVHECRGDRREAVTRLFLTHGITPFFRPWLKVCRTSPEPAKARGIGLLFTETGTPVGDEPNPSLSNMRKHGFKPLYLRENFAPKGTTW